MANKVVTLQQDNGFHDSLDGVVLTAGEKLYIRWPSGATQPVEVLIDVAPRGVLQDGSIVTIACSKAYIQVGTFGGDAARVYLNGFAAQRIR
jgi:hypothetical protein